MKVAPGSPWSIMHWLIDLGLEGSKTSKLALSWTFSLLMVGRMTIKLLACEQYSGYQVLTSLYSRIVVPAFSSINSCPFKMERPHVRKVSVNSVQISNVSMLAIFTEDISNNDFALNSMEGALKRTLLERCKHRIDFILPDKSTFYVWTFGYKHRMFIISILPILRLVRKWSLKRSQKKQFLYEAPCF